MEDINVFKVNDTDWVAAKTKDEAINWYLVDYEGTNIYPEEHILEASLNKLFDFIDEYGCKYQVNFSSLIYFAKIRNIPFPCLLRGDDQEI